MSNPYASPNEVPQYDNAAGLPGGVGPRRSSGFVNQVLIVAILMFVQAGLELLLGLYLLGFSVAMGTVGRAEMEKEFARNPSNLPPEFLDWLCAGYAIIGIVLVVVAALKIYAGIGLLRFRGRTTGIVSISAGLVTALTCFCAPTAIGLAIYGLIVLLNEDVREAFAMGARGHSPAKIKATFS